MSHRNDDVKPTSSGGLDHDSIQFLVKIFRDLGIALLGGYGFFHEVAREGSERPYILVACMAMLGLPGIIRLDERRQEAKKSNEHE